MNRFALCVLYAVSDVLDATSRFVDDVASILSGGTPQRREGRR